MQEVNARNSNGTTGTVKAKYLYAADGTKLKVQDAAGTNGNDYLGSLTLVKNSNVTTAETAFAEGIIRGTEIMFFEKDHLGSVRSVLNASGQVIEKNDYYPFSMRHYNSAHTISANNRFKFNGMEDQTTGSIGSLDYGARMYDPVIGRWFNMDQLAEKYFGLSPYSYCANNPVNAIDPDGRLTVFVNGYDPKGAILHEAGQIDRFSRPGMRLKDYNSSVDRSFQKKDNYGWGGLDDFYKTQYNDNNALYVSGSYSIGTKASTRYDGGVAKANELIAMINSGEIKLSEGEKIRLVGYSQGAAYAAGMASVLGNSQYADIFDFVDYVAAHQPDGFDHPNSVLGRQFGSSNDRFADRGTKINNINDVNHHIGDFGKLINGGGHLLGDGFNLNNFVMDVIRAGGTVTVY